MAELPMAIGLGAAFSLISMAPFMPTLKPPEGPHTTVWVGAGQPHVDKVQDKADVYKSQSFGGKEPNLALFTNDGGRIGTHTAKGNIKDGAVSALDVMHWDGKHGMPGASYLTVSAGGTDALCIAHVSVKDPTDAEGVGDYRFVPGEIAKQCNSVGKDYPWFPSDAMMEIDKDGQQYHVYPNCLMIDSTQLIDNSNQIQQASVPYKGFTIHLPDFSKDNSHWDQWQNDMHQMCDNNARFMMYKDLNQMVYPDIFETPNTPEGAPLPIPTVAGGHPDITHTAPESDPDCFPKQNKDKCPYNIHDVYKKSGVPSQFDKRARRDEGRKSAEERVAIQKRTPFHRKLVKSSIEEHSAVDVCNDPATKGPHFYSTLEQMFCETDTHTLYPSCTKDPTVDCFDPETDRINSADGQPPERIQKRNPEGYHSVKSWSPQPGRRRLV